MASQRLQVEVVDRTQRLWHGSATAVTVPAAEGQLGILPGRAPVLAVLRGGKVDIDPVDGERMQLEVSSGFVSVDANFVTIVVGDANFAQ